MFDEEKNEVGRPLKFKSPEELQERIDEYFESCFEESWGEDEEGRWKPDVDRYGEIKRVQVRPFTISGLAVFLDTDRKTLLNYESREEYFLTIKKAKAKIENYTEEQLYNTQAKNMTGIIFNLKNNYGWQDKQQIENTGSLDHRVSLGELSDDEINERIAQEVRAIAELQARTATPYQR